MTLLARRRAESKPAAPKARDGSGLGPTVAPDGTIRFLSVSQLEKFDPEVYGGCERRWYFRYVAREKEPQKGAQKLGDQAHAQLEHYLKTGDDVLGEIVRSGRRFIPAPGSDLLVEVKFGELAWPGPVEAPVVSQLIAGGVPLTGKADLMHARGEYLDDEGVAHPQVDTAEALDWKTTKQIDDVFDLETGNRTSQGYAKTAEELADTWQMLGYGELAWQRWPHIKYVRLGHGYFQTKGKREASKRSIVLPIDFVRERWRESDALVERMKVVAKAKRAEDVAANYGSCSSYGGCPHRQKCPRDVGRLLADMFGGKADALRISTAAAVAGEDSMSLLAKRKLTMAGGAAAPPTVSLDVKSEIAKLEAEEAAIRAGNSITPPDVPAPSKTAEPHPPESPHALNLKVEAECGHTVPKAETSTLPNGAVKHIGCPTADRPLAGLDTNPPAYAPPTAVAGPCAVGGTQIECDMDLVASKKYTCVCGVEKLKVKPQKLGDGKYYALVPKHDIPKTEAQITATAVQQAINAPVETPAPSARERVAAVLGDTTAPKPGDKVRRAVQDASGEIQDVLVLGGVDLYLDASEDGVATARLEAYAEKICAGLCEKYQAADVRCAPEGTPLAFGKWKGAVAALAKAEPPAPGAYIVSANSEIGMVVFEALASLKLGRVVRRGA